MLTQIYEVLLEFLGIVTTPDFPEELRLIRRLRFHIHTAFPLGATRKTMKDKNCGGTDP